MVMTVGLQSEETQFETYGQPIFGSRFMKSVSRISGGIEILVEILVEGFDT